MNDDNENEQEMLWAAQDLRTMTSNRTEVNISRRLILSPINSGPKWDYFVTFGDLMNRGPWRWECAQSESLKATVEITKAQIVAQGDERAREFLHLQDAAAKLGLKLVEVTP
jgi:hypothetical protein